MCEIIAAAGIAVVKSFRGKVRARIRVKIVIRVRVEIKVVESGLKLG